MGAISDEDLTKIGVAIGNDRNIVKFVLLLGFSYTDAKSCRSANRDKQGNITCVGTQMILSNWKKVTDAEEQSTKLRTALEESGLEEIANIFLPEKSKRKREIHVKKEPTDERGCEEGTVKKQKILDPAACTSTGDQHGTPAKKAGIQIAATIKTEPQEAHDDQPTVSPMKGWSCTVGAIGDEVLNKIGAALGNDKKSIAKLASHLGISTAKELNILAYADANRNKGQDVTCAGTLLLLHWKKVTNAEEQSMKLRTALQESGLKEIATILLPKYSKHKSGSPTSKSGSPAKGENTKAREPPRKQTVAVDLSADTMRENQPAPAGRPYRAVAVKVTPKAEPQSAPKWVSPIAPPKTVLHLPTALPKTPQQPKRAPQVTSVLKVPSMVKEQVAPAQIAPQASSAKATEKSAAKGAPSHGTKKKKKEKGGASLEAKQKELEKEEKELKKSERLVKKSQNAVKKFEREVKKSQNAIKKLKAAIFKMEETERIQLEKTLAETKAKLDKLSGTPK